MGEVEKNSFIDLPGKWEHKWFVPQKPVCPKLGGFGEEFYSKGSRVELQRKIMVFAGPALLQSGLRSSFFVSLHSLSSLISNCSNLPFGTQEGVGGWSLFLANKENRGYRKESHRVLLSFIKRLL